MKKIKEVYVVLERETDEPVAVFSDFDDAYSYCAKCENFTWSSLYLDEQLEFARSSYFHHRVGMYSDGEVIYVERVNPNAYTSGRSFYRSSLNDLNERLKFETICLAKDNEHAIANADEIRKNMIANGEIEKAIAKYEDLETIALAKSHYESLQGEEREEFGKIMDVVGLIPKPR